MRGIFFVLVTLTLGTGVGVHRATAEAASIAALLPSPPPVPYPPPLFAAAACAALLTLAGSLLVITRERAAFALAAACLLAAMLMAADGGLLSQGSFPNHIRLLIASLAGSWLTPALLVFQRNLFDSRIAQMAVPASIAVALMISLVVLIARGTVPEPVLWIAACVQLLMAMGVVTAAAAHGHPYAPALLIAQVLLVVAAARSFRDNHTLLHCALLVLMIVSSWTFTIKYGVSTRAVRERLSARFRDELELRTRELCEKNQTLEQAHQALQRANDALKQLSITDGLTQVANRMYFEQQFELEWRRCARQNLPLSVLMIDADHFKRLNDSAGHLAGDQCLQTIAMEIQRHFKRAGELVARYGGEEFVVLLPDTNQTKALAVAEGLRVAVERLTIHHGPRQYRVTISVGVSTTIPGGDQTTAQLLAAADAALYEAKEAGRNRVHSIPVLSHRAIMAQQQLRL